MQRCNEADYRKKLDYLEEHLLNMGPFTESDCHELLAKIHHFKSAFKEKWLAANKTDNRFRMNNEKWLQSTFTIPKVLNISTGRPKKIFDELSERSKRRKTEQVRQSMETEELAYAAQMKLRAAGEPDAANILKDITNHPDCAKDYKKAYKTKQPEERDAPLSALEALTRFVEAGLSRKQYDIIRSGAPKTYPCYSLLQKVKKECYPGPNAYKITATCLEINLQDLLDHTSARLIQFLREVIDTLNENEINSLQLITKWGCDGSQQARYQQKFENIEDSDSNIFQSSLVPLQLFTGTDGGKKIIWQNPTPSSPRYCRPIRILFATESAELIQDEVKYIQNKIDNLKETRIEGEKIIIIKHKLCLTMVDGKVCNAVSNVSSTMRCYICGATSKMFNTLVDSEETNIDGMTLNFGLSILHARIRLFETLLHLSYKLPVKKWQLRCKEDKDVVETRKKEIQDLFRARMGLLVDIPKQGFGNTNNGNTSRRFFMDPELAANITGIDIDLIYRIKVILEVISSGFKIDLDKFSTYTRDTAKLYVQLYPWHPMSPTMHKILIHGKTVIQNALLPIGQLSEEAAEARNKHFRLYRLNYTRKFSREACNMDIINRLLLTSDPLITSLRPNPKKTGKQLLRETLEMLLPPDIVTEDEDSEVDLELLEDVEDEESWESSSD